MRQGCIFSPDLFIFYSNAILIVLEAILRFIILDVILTIIRYVDDTVLMTNSERKLQGLLDRMLEESKKKKKWTSHQLQEERNYGHQQEKNSKM